MVHTAYLLQAASPISSANRAASRHRISARSSTPCVTHERAQHYYWILVNAGRWLDGYEHIEISARHTGRGTDLLSSVPTPQSVPPNLESEVILDGSVVAG